MPIDETLISSSFMSEGKFFCSWSGGKDSALALYRTLKKEKSSYLLLTMMIESGERSRSHGIPKYILEKQAESLGIPIHFSSTRWSSYTECFLEKLKSFKTLGIKQGIFGDIDIEIHRQWVQSVCDAENITPHLPLWQENRAALLNELIELGFRAEIISVKKDILSSDYLGRVLNRELIEEFRNLNIDLCGENGEYHTLVTGGPMFATPLNIIHTQKVLRDGYWFSDVSLKEI
jgi:diphthine-ammonia ligase